MIGCLSKMVRRTLSNEVIDNIKKMLHTMYQADLKLRDRSGVSMRENGSFSAPEHIWKFFAKVSVLSCNLCLFTIPLIDL